MRLHPRLLSVSLLLLLTLLVANGQSGEITDYNPYDYAITDFATVRSDLLLEGAPADAVITKVKIYFELEHSYEGDLDIWVTAYYNGGWHDYPLYSKGDLGNPTELKEVRDNIHTWDGASANQTWYLVVRDNVNLDEGNITFFQVWVSYVVPYSDLWLSDVSSVNPAPLYPGEDFDVYCRQNYEGTITDQIYPKVGYYLSSNPTLDAADELLDFDESSLSSSEPFEDEHQELTVPGDKAPGSYYLIFKTDYLNEIPENNEVNNLSILPLRVDPPIPTANFSADKNSGEVPFNVQFFDNSLNKPTSWKWAFGDGNTSQLQNPSHNYSIPGNYTVSLTVSNAYGTDQIIKSNYINADGPPPVADFSANNRIGVYPLTVQFYDNSSNNPTSWNWTFGDGNTSNLQNPTHTFLTPGIYSISLSSSNVYGSDQITKSNYITVNGKPPETDFTADNQTGFNPLSVKFTDLSKNEPSSWNWQFGDGTSSILQHPAHEYYNPGNYTVTLITYNDYGNDTETKNSFITVNENPPVAEFSADNVSGKYPLNVSFSDLSSNASAWQWEFGDGETSNQQNPLHSYTIPDIYTVQLTVSNSFSSDTEIKTNYIEVTGDTPTALFSAEPTIGSAPLEVDFTDLSSYATNWSWNFGDETTIFTAQNPKHTYTEPGIYSVTLIVSNEYGSDSIYMADYIEVINSATSVNHNQSLNLIKIIPNPARDFISIQSNYQISRIEIYSITGKKLVDRITSSQYEKIAIDDLNKGLFLVKITTEKQISEYHKLIIE